MIKALFKDGRSCFTFQKISKLYNGKEDSLRHLLVRCKKQGIWVLPSYNQDINTKVFFGEKRTKTAFFTKIIF